jgi:aminotransferase
MTGWRIGFVHSDEEIIREIVKVHDAMVTCAPVISQYAAMAAFDFADKDIEYFRKEYANRRDITMKHLDDLSEFFSYQKPNGAYFVFPKLLPKRDSWQFAYDLIEKAHVAVVPGAAFGPNGEGHIRISFGRTAKDIDRSFERIKTYFKKQA